MSKLNSEREILWNEGLDISNSCRFILIPIIQNESTREKFEKDLIEFNQITENFILEIKEYQTKINNLINLY